MKKKIKPKKTDNLSNKEDFISRIANGKHKFAKCFLLSCVALIITVLCINRIDYVEQNYDYSNIYEVHGTVTKVGDRAYDSSLSGGDSRYEMIDLEDGGQVTINIGGAMPDSVGDYVTVYTDGTYCEFTERGVAMDNTNTFIFLLIPCIFIMLAFVAWVICYGWKGFLIAFIMFLLIYGIYES